MLGEEMAEGRRGVEERNGRKWQAEEEKWE
jgi:hypothetical protein